MSWMIDECHIRNEAAFWTNSGLFVYSAVGGLLVYRLCWTLLVRIWSEFDINYIALFKTSNNKPNTTHILNESMTVVFLYFLSMFFYFRVNSDGLYVDSSFSRVLSPLLLVAGLLLSLLYRSTYSSHVDRVHFQTRDLFAPDILLRCACAPFVPVTFRDNYVADALTSFTKVIADAVYASCWLLSTLIAWSSSSNDPESTSTSSSPSSSSSAGSTVAASMCMGRSIQVVVAMCVVVPLWIRFAQCLRNFWDSTLVFPHVWNALKYALSALVVLYGVGVNTSDSFYYFLIVLATLYKWWWDVFMDWGLFDTFMKTGNLCVSGERTRLFLRPSLLYRDPRLYYICIVLDLVLRFLWVLSLAPASLTSVMYVMPALSIFLGSIEIVRRSMWGVFRVEWEHLKVLQNGSNSVDELIQQQQLQLQQQQQQRPPPTSIPPETLNPLHN